MLRKFAAAVLGVVVVSTGVLAAPSRVWASGDGDVEFPTEQAGAETLIYDWSANDDGCSSFTADDDAYLRSASGQANIAPHESGGCRGSNGATVYFNGGSVEGTFKGSSGLESYVWTPSAQYRIEARFCPDDGADAVAVYNGLGSGTSRSLGSAFGSMPSKVSANGRCGPTGGHGSPAVLDSTGFASGTSTGLALVMTGTYVGLIQVRIWAVAGAQGGDCGGVGSMTGVFIENTAGGNDWGDQWAATAGGLCRATGAGNEAYVMYKPGAGDPIVAGNLYEVESVVRSQIGSPIFEVYWINASNGMIGGPIVTARVAASANFRIFHFEDFAPAGAAGLMWRMGGYLWQQSHYVLDLEDAEPGEGPADERPTIPGATDLGSSCTQPDEFWEVVNWLGYLVCVVQWGFHTVLVAINYAFDLTFSAIAALLDLMGIIDAVESVWSTLIGIPVAIAGALAEFFGNVVDAVVALPGLIWDGFVGVLEGLFIPVTLGNSWESFKDNIGIRVPFGWFAQLEAAISTGLGGTGSLPTLSLFGVSVTAPLGTALSAVAPFRGLILAGAALLMVPAILRWVLAAVGVSPSRSAEGAT